jgi:hypothetical protein
MSPTSPLPASETQPQRCRVSVVSAACAPPAMGPARLSRATSARRLAVSRSTVGTASVVAVVVLTVVSPYVRVLFACDTHANHVKCPPALASAAARLMEMNRLLVAGEDGAPTVAAVEAAADQLDARMHLASTIAARSVPGASPVGGRVRSSGASAASGSAPAGDQLVTLLGSLVEVGRNLAEAYRQVVRMRPACDDQC